MDAQVLKVLGTEAAELAAERKAYMAAKAAKAKAENEVLDEVLRAARPALPAISSKVQVFLVSGSANGIHLGGGLYLDEHGGFRSAEWVPMTYNEVMRCTTPAAIVSVVLTAIRAQRGSLEPRRAEIVRETGILEGIAAAFKAGRVK